VASVASVVSRVLPRSPAVSRGLRLRRRFPGQLWPAV